jgi:hypothetical protein
MSDLLTRTISQGLQAFLPIAFCLTWFRRSSDADALAGLRGGLVAAIPATAGAAYWFQISSRQAEWEAALAAAALALAIWFVRTVRQGLPPSPRAIVEPRLRQACRLAFVVGAALIIARQTMEIAIAFGAAFQLRASEPLLAVTGGVAVSLAASALWLSLGRRLPDAALCKATNVFAVLFVGQVAVYAFHESTEARLLPWSDILHAATEPYGPDGLYGRYLSALLFVIPLAVAVVTLLSRRIPRRSAGNWRRRVVIVPSAVVAVAVCLAAGLALMGAVAGDRAISYASFHPTAPPLHDVATIAAAPHLLFRHTIVDQNYGRLSITSPDARQIADRAAADLTCDRVSYAAGHGICLQTLHGVFATYQAMLFARTFNTTRTIKLDGRPSRTRISSDGRVGAITVFVTGQHGYAGSAFSTKTTILDMSTGDELGDLEQFTTWRDGARFKSGDFNFWGVTFARDSNVFYATLRTAGTTSHATTYLVRGDLGLRKLTVLRENVECPSLSPDNRLIAFKKRVGPDAAPWRFYVLDLARLTDRPIAAETRSIDDQIEWLDDDHVLYAVRRSGNSSSLDVWVAPLDNSAPARVFMPEAESPIVVR